MTNTENLQSAFRAAIAGGWTEETHTAPDGASVSKFTVRPFEAAEVSAALESEVPEGYWILTLEGESLTVDTFPTWLRCDTEYRAREAASRD